MLINFSNHPLTTWSKEQVEAAKEYGEIIDLPFPAVNPDASHEEIKDLADEFVEKILSISKERNVTVHIMGEMTFCFMVVSSLKEKGIECIASTSNRNTEVTSDNKKISDFQFVRFRKY